MVGVWTRVLLVNAVQGDGQTLRNLRSAVLSLLVSDGYPTFITVCIPTAVLPITHLLVKEKLLS